MSADEERQAILGLALASLPNGGGRARGARQGEGGGATDAGRSARDLDRAHRGAGSRKSASTPGLPRPAGQDRPPDGVLEARAPTRADARTSSCRLAVVEGAATGTSARSCERPRAEASDGERRTGGGAPPTTPGPRPSSTSSDDDPVNGTVMALQQVSLRPDEHDHWTEFALAGEPPLQLTDAEDIHRPLCTDDQTVVMPNGLDAVRTAVWLWSDKPASEFADWTDPRQWANDCSLFFKSVAPKAGEPVPAKADEFSRHVHRDGLRRRRQRPCRPTSCSAGRRQGPGPATRSSSTCPRRRRRTARRSSSTAGQVTVRTDPNAAARERTALLAEKYILLQGSSVRGLAHGRMRPVLDRVRHRDGARLLSRPTRRPHDRPDQGRQGPGDARQGREPRSRRSRPTPTPPPR